MDDHVDHRKVSKEEATVKPTRSFRYEDYSTRRVFLRSYPLQWDWDDEKQGLGDGDGPWGTIKNRPAYGSSDGEDDRGDERRGGSSKDGWRKQVAVAVVEWGEEKIVLLRRAKKRLAMYLLGCHHGRRRPALPPFRSDGSATAAMLPSR